MNITSKHIDALKYVESGEYRLVGGRNSSLGRYIYELRENGYLAVKCCGDSSKLILTLKANCFMASIS